MTVADWFKFPRQRRRERRQKRFRTAWRLANNAVLIAGREGLNSESAMVHRASALVRQYQVSGFVSSLLISLAIELIPFLVKLLIDALMHGERDRDRALNQMQTWSYEVERQVLNQLGSNDQPQQIEESVPVGSIPEVLSILSELFTVLAKLWDALSGEEK